MSLLKTRFERSFEDFYYRHAFGDDEKIFDKHDALMSIAVLINLEEEAGVRRGYSVTVSGEKLGEIM